MPSAKLLKKRKKAARIARAALKSVPLPEVVVEDADEPVEAQTELQSEPQAEPTGLGPDFSSFPWRERVTPIILLALMTFAVYIKVIHYPFSNYDDGEYVGDNLKIQQGLNWPTVRWALTSTEHANWHPVTWLSHALDWQLFGPDASGHHLTSLMLHLANVVLLFLFLVRVTKSIVRSLLVASLFAVHPIGVESVAWISERKTVLCMMFCLLALLAYAAYARRPNITRYLLVALLFALSLASKPMAVTFPFVLLLVDYWPLQRIQGWIEPSPNFEAPQFPFWKLALEKLPLLAFSVADSVVTVIAQQKVSAIRDGGAFPLYLRLENAIFAYANYVWKAVWPTRLAVLYPYPAGGLPVVWLLLSAVFLMAMSVWVWRERRRPYLVTGWLWFLGTLVPVIGLVQVGEQSMADRYAYLPIIGLFLLVVWGVSDLAEKIHKPQRWAVAGGAGVVLIVLAILCARQVGYWRSNLDLWGHAAAVTENNNVAEDVVGSEILVDAMNHGVRYSDEAQTHFQKAVQINPQDSEAIMNIGADLQEHGQLLPALQKYQEALQYVKDDSMRAQILCDIATVYEKNGNYPTARSYYQQSMKYKSKSTNVAFMGFARTFTDEKIVEMVKQLTDHPTAEGFYELGQLQDAGAYTASATMSYRKALELNPELTQAKAALEHDAKILH